MKACNLALKLNMERHECFLLAAHNLSAFIVCSVKDIIFTQIIMTEKNVFCPWRTKSVVVGLVPSEDFDDEPILSLSSKFCWFSESLKYFL